MSDSDLSGTVLDGRYTVIEPIAEGAMGSVYRGERLKLGRAVAIKIMHEELPDELASRQRFEREAKLMALLEHPNCVSVIDFGVHDDKPFLVMDLVRGTSLLALLDKERRLEVPAASDIIRQVLSGLAHAHELGIVHRDIKPANIMISEKAGYGQQVRILDFGLARLTEGSTKLTTGIVVGTPNYMAPEQCKGGDIDARTDLYACGVMYFEMLTGRKPFVADEPLQVVRKHLLEKAPTLASVDPQTDYGELEGIVAKALAKSPAERFDSAVEMAKAIEVAAAKQTKSSAAALYARAVPEGGSTGTAGSQLATMSGWNVPASGGSTAVPADRSVPAAVAVPVAAPVPAAPSAQMPVTSSQPEKRPAVPSAPSSGTSSQPNRARPPTPAPTRASMSSASDSLSVPAAPAASLPPLPSAKPYVPPPGIGASVPATADANPASDSVAADTAPASPEPSPRSPVATSAAGARPIPQLPFTKKQLMIGGGAVLGVIILIAIAFGGGSNKKASTAKPTTGSGSSAVAAPETPDESVSSIAAKATGLIDNGQHEAAVALLKRARKQYPDDAKLAFLAGKAQFGQLYWSDGVQNFRDAIKLDPSYKENPELLKIVLKGFLTTPDVDDRIVSFMRHDIGLPMRPYLEETAEKHPKKALRMRASAELNAGR